MGPEIGRRLGFRRNLGVRAGFRLVWRIGTLRRSPDAFASRNDEAATT
jgi:hypothetical protein